MKKIIIILFTAIVITPVSMFGQEIPDSAITTIEIRYTLIQQ